MESYSTQAILSVADHGFTTKMKAAADSLDRLETGSKKASRGIMDIAKGVGVFKALSMAGNTLSNSLGAAVDRFDTMERFPKVMEQMGFSAKESTKSIQDLSNGIKGLPTSLDGITASTQRIAVLTGNLDMATDTALALNNAFLASGSTTADAERGLNQYVQMLSKGSVDMQSWRTLQETMGYALSEMAKELGIATGNSNELYDALQNGEISFTQFNDAMITCSTRTGGFADKAKSASAGIKTSFENLGIAVTRGMANTIQSVDATIEKIDGTGIAGKLDSVSNTIDRFFEITAEGAQIAIQALNMLTPYLATVTAGYLAFEGVAGTQKVWNNIKKGGAETRVILEAIANKEKLAAEAASAKERAVKAAARARELDNAASAASARAIEAETIARKSAMAASKAKTAAEAAERAEIKVKTAEEKAAAAVTKSRTAQEKAAAAVTKAKANAEKAGAVSSELSAKAEAMDMAATKASAIADEKALTASMAKATADSMEAKAAELGTIAETKKTLAEEAGNIAEAKGSVLAIAKSAALGVLSGSMKITEAAQMSLNAAMAANPIGTVIMMVTALTAVLIGVSKAISKLDTRTQELQEKQQEAVGSAKELTEELKSSSKAYKDNMSDVEASAKANKKLADDIANLASKEKKSAQDKATLKVYVDSLNASMEGLNLQYDEENEALSMSNDALMSKVKAYEATEQAAAAQERLLEVQKEQAQIELEQQELAEKRNQYEREWQELNDTSPASMGRYTKALQEMNEQEDALNSKKEELAQSEETLKNIMVESQAAQSEAVNTGVESQKISMEMLNETQQAVVQSMSSTWQSYADQATDMFNTLSDESELSVAKMTENLQENQRIIGEWANNIESLAQRGVNEGLLEQLRQAGPESAGYVNAMVQASDTELQALSDAFAAGGETATTAFKTAFRMDDIPQDVMDMVTQTEQSLREQIQAADFNSIGQNVGQGLSSGISESTGQAAEASSTMGESVNTSAANTMGINSPSTVFMGYGRNLIDGLIIGIQSSSGRVSAAMSATMSHAGQTAVSALNRSMSDMEKVNASVFSRISITAKAGMSQMSAAVTSGMSRSNAAMQSGMKAMNAAEQAGMRTMKATMTSGMSGMSQAVDRGMNQSKASVDRGRAGMIASLNTLRSGFYNSGYYASMGLAQGIDAGAGAALSAAQRLADKVASTMERALKINSPSKVTMRIGEYAGMGAAVGLMNTLPDVEKAGVKISGAMTPGTISDYVASISAKSRTDSYAFQSGYKESTAGYDYLIEGLKEAIANLNIQVQAVISSRDVGNASSKYVDRNLGTRSAVRERYGCV